MKERLREFYEKAKRERWNGTTQLDWSSTVDPESEWPINPNLKELLDATIMESASGQIFRSMLFMRVMPNLCKLGLITPRVREAFERLDIIKFEHPDTDEQHRELDLA